jgi:hypothetical protein
MHLSIMMMVLNRKQEEEGGILTTSSRPQATTSSRVSCMSVQQTSDYKMVHVTVTVRIHVDKINFLLLALHMIYLIMLIEYH